MYLAKGDLEYAIRVLDQGLALCRASGPRSWLRGIVGSLGYASALQGRLAEGRALLEEAIREEISTGALGHHSGLLARLSEVYSLAGHGDEAGQHARQALDLARQQKERGDEALALHQLGIVHAHADPPDTEQAAVHYQQALALAEELGMRPLQSHCHRGLGTLYAKIGQREQARAALSTAIELYRAMEMTFWLPAGGSRTGSGSLKPWPWEGQERTQFDHGRGEARACWINTAAASTNACASPYQARTSWTSKWTRST